MAEPKMRAVSPRNLTGREWCHRKNLAHVRAWARAGQTEREIAEHMGITLPTLRRWRDQYPALDIALDESWVEAVEAVENALYRRAVGFEYQEEVRITEDTPRGRQERIEYRTHFVPGDTTAQIFFLKNRAPDRWNDRRQVSIESTVKVMERQAQDLLDVMDIALGALNMTPDQRARLPQLVQAAIEAKGLATGPAAVIEGETV